MYDDTAAAPLFGEQKPQTKAFYYLVGFIVGGFSLFSVSVAFAKGIDEGAHIMLGITTLCLTIVTGVLVYWYRQGDLDPKFKGLIWFLLFSVVMASVTVQIYVWQGDEPGAGCKGLYWRETGDCFDPCEDGFCLLFPGGGCRDPNPPPPPDPTPIPTRPEF